MARHGAECFSVRHSKVHVYDTQFRSYTQSSVYVSSSSCLIFEVCFLKGLYQLVATLCRVFQLQHKQHKWLHGNCDVCLRRQISKYHTARNHMRSQMIFTELDDFFNSSTTSILQFHNCTWRFHQAMFITSPHNSCFQNLWMIQQHCFYL